MLCTISLSEEERDENIYTESIQPRLEANLYRPRVLAVKKEADDRPFRQKVLGRASQPCLDVSGGECGRVRSEEEQELEGTGIREGAVAIVVPDTAVAGSKRKCC
jgi:hypothetical protein